MNEATVSEIEAMNAKHQQMYRYFADLLMRQHREKMRTPPGYGKKHMARICATPWQPHERVKRGNPARNPTALA